MWNVVNDIIFFAIAFALLKKKSKLKIQKLIVLNR